MLFALEGGQAREVQCHCLRASPGARWAVGAGQMSRVDSVKIAVMKAQQPLAGSVVGFRRLLPVPRRSGGGRARWSDGGDPAGRFGARRGCDRRCRSPGAGDGVYGCAAFSALIGWGTMIAGRTWAERPHVRPCGGRTWGTQPGVLASATIRLRSVAGYKN